MKNHTLYDQLQVLEPQEKELDARERIKAMERPLLSWYREHARAFHGGTSRNHTGYGYRKSCSSRPEWRL